MIRFFIFLIAVQAWNGSLWASQRCKVSSLGISSLFERIADLSNFIFAYSSVALHSDLIVALDRSQYSGGRHCGNFLNVCHQDRCVRVKVRSLLLLLLKAVEYSPNSFIAFVFPKNQIVDECPECHYGEFTRS